MNEFIMIVFMIGLCSFTYGACTVNEPKEDSCKYRAIIEYVNIPYVAGCELARKRWNK